MDQITGVSRRVHSVDEGYHFEEGYGIELARLVGLPAAFLADAQELSLRLGAERHDRLEAQMQLNNEDKGDISGRPGVKHPDH